MARKRLSRRVLKAKAELKRSSADTLPSRALSAGIAHELNNIAVPLRGFVDLAFQTTMADEQARQSLDELYVGLNRIAVLAFQLESLAQQGATIVTTTLGACFASIERTGFDERSVFAWSCSQATPVTVDIELARRAIAALELLAGAGPLSIREAVLGAGACATCGQRLRRHEVYAEISTFLRPAVLQAVRAPFETSQKLRAMQRLALAALSHCSHLAGGHLVTDSHTESLGIVLPR